MTITIQHDGDTWTILGEGSARNGKVCCHLASTTRGRQQRNGWVPLQIIDWIDSQIILSAAMQNEEIQRRQYISDYYTDRANGAHAAKSP